MSPTGVQAWTHVALRIVSGFLFLQHGYPKLFGTLPGSAEVEVPRELLTIFWWSGFLEVVGGVLIMIGLFTRPVAFVVAGEMAVAYFWRLAPRDFWPGSNGGAGRAVLLRLSLPGRGGRGWLESGRGTGPTGGAALIRYGSSAGGTVAGSVAS
jgi:uncharacterized membrane protein YphA (DoxX/SURF4 family)